MVMDGMHGVCMYLSIYVCTYLSIHPVYLSIYLSIRIYIYDVWV